MGQIQRNMYCKEDIEYNLVFAKVTLNSWEGEWDAVAQSAAQDGAASQHKQEQKCLGMEKVSQPVWDSYNVCIVHL